MKTNPLCSLHSPPRPKSNTHQTKNQQTKNVQDFVNPNPLNATSPLWQSISFAFNSRLHSEHLPSNSTHILDILCYKHRLLFFRPSSRMLSSVLILSVIVSLSLATVTNTFKSHWFYMVKFYLFIF